MTSSTTEYKPKHAAVKKPARSRSKRKKPLLDRASAWLWQHEALAFVVIALAVVACFALTIWFVVFSGLASSAELIYSQF